MTTKKNVKTALFRQGDILFRKVESLPSEQLTEQTDNIVALGEATGHHHRAVGAQVLLYQQTNTKYVVVPPEGATISHEEHKPIELQEGIYEVVPQVEYNPAEERRVRD